MAFSLPASFPPPPARLLRGSSRRRVRSPLLAMSPVPLPGGLPPSPELPPLQTRRRSAARLRRAPAAELRTPRSSSGAGGGGCGGAPPASPDGKVAILVSAAVTVAFAVANRVLYKLALVPMKQYPFFLAQVTTFGSVFSPRASSEVEYLQFIVSFRVWSDFILLLLASSHGPRYPSNATLPRPVHRAAVLSMTSCSRHSRFPQPIRKTYYPSMMYVPIGKSQVCGNIFFDSLHPLSSWDSYWRDASISQIAVCGHWNAWSPGSGCWDVCRRYYTTSLRRTNYLDELRGSIGFLKGWNLLVVCKTGMDVIAVYRAEEEWSHSCLLVRKKI